MGEKSGPYKFSHCENLGCFHPSSNARTQCLSLHLQSHVVQHRCPLAFLMSDILERDNRFHALLQVC